jgi:hypothetical protein
MLIFAYIGTIASTNDETTVQHKLHVAGTRCPEEYVSCFALIFLMLTYSVPAVEICSLRSEAGVMISALLTL